MTIIIDPYTIPEKGRVELEVKRSFEIKVSAEEARQRVRWWLRDEVSMLIDAEAPTLVVGEQVVWRVPAVFSAPGAGRVGVVGLVEVDVTTGEMNITPELKAAIEHQAKVLAERLPPYQPKGPAPEKYRPKHIPPAPQIVYDEHGLPVVVPANPQKTG
jgi:hypothetical protein